jgi:hypothetical protein
MSLDRATIFSESLRICAKAVTWYFIADYYDRPLAGLAYFRDRLYACYYFPTDLPQQQIYVLQELTAEELTEELRLKDKFEALVGTHWSFDRAGQPLPRILRPPALSQRFYQEEQSAAREYLSDRPISGWFDHQQSRPGDGDPSGQH